MSAPAVLRDTEVAVLREELAAVRAELAPLDRGVVEAGVTASRALAHSQAPGDAVAGCRHVAGLPPVPAGAPAADPGRCGVSAARRLSVISGGGEPEEPADRDEELAQLFTAAENLSAIDRLAVIAFATLDDLQVIRRALGKVEDCNRETVRKALAVLPGGAV